MIDACAVAEAHDISLNRFMLDAFIVQSLSRFEENPHYSWIIPFKLRYTSLAGERESKKYNLFLHAKPLTMVIGDPPIELEGVPNWSSLYLEARISIGRAYERRSLPSELAIRLRRLRQRFAAWLSVVSEKPRRKMRDLILHGGRSPPEFKIGDRVLLKADADWELLEDESQEEAPVEAREINPNRWHPANGEEDASDEEVASETPAASHIQVPGEQVSPQTKRMTRPRTRNPKKKRS